MRKKVKTKWGVNISGDGDILVKVGDQVSEGQILARIKDKKVESFDFSEIFNKVGGGKLVELNDKFSGSRVCIGEVLYSGRGIFASKVCFPAEGNFLGLDEFGILRIEGEGKGEKEIIAPVNGKILKVEKDRLSIGFDVYEFKGEGLVEGKTWGKGEIKLINEIKDLSSNLKNGLLFTENLSNIFLLKAEVVGIKGIVTNVKNEEISTDLPVLYLGEEEWKDLFKSEGETKNFLLNSRLGRLLMVLE